MTDIDDINVDSVISSCSNDTAKDNQPAEMNIDYKDMYLRSLADMENLRKRTNNQIAEIMNSANRDIILDILTILDDMKRLETGMNTDNDDKCMYLKGFIMIRKNLEKLLSEEGCERIECEPGMDFDCNVHESMYLEENNDIESGKISRIINDGWLLNGKLLRAVKVSVVK